MHSALRFSRKDARKVKRFLRQPRRCLLCGAFPTVCNVILQPHKPEAWGGKPGKVRLLGYALCIRCIALPDASLRAEAPLMRDVVGRRN